MLRTAEQAKANLEALLSNSYPGRIIVLGRTPNRAPVQIYGIMGRSEGSRNRVLVAVLDKPGCLKTRVADPSGFTGDASLLIYTAMAEKPNWLYVVSNGAQTDAVMENGVPALAKWRYEPDDPNFTPRITGIYTPGEALDMQLVMLRKSPFNEKCDCLAYGYGEVAAGYGYLISTYMGDGNPLPSFQGEPLLVPISSDNPGEIAEAYWAVFNKDNMVSLAVKVIQPDGLSDIRVINRHAIA